jgi:hypothetical protein
MIIERKRRAVILYRTRSSIDARPLAAEFAVGHREECQEKIELDRQACWA